MGDEVNLDQITDLLEDSGSGQGELSENIEESSDESQENEDQTAEEINEEPQQKLYEDPISDEYKTRANNDAGGRIWEQEEKEHFNLTILK